MSWTSADKSPLPTEVNIEGGISRAEASLAYSEWLLVQDPRAVLGAPEPGDIEGQFTTCHDQIGIMSSVPGVNRCDWSAYGVQVSGGYHHAKITNFADPGHPKTLPIRYCLIDGLGFETMQSDRSAPIYIRRIRQIEAPTIHDDGTYTPARYSVVPTKIMPGQDLFTFDPREGGALLEGQTEDMLTYIQGNRRGQVQRTYGKGTNIHGPGDGDQTIVKWKHFDMDGYPMTEFETSGPVPSIIQVPKGYTGAPQCPGGESTCTGFFVPDAL